MANAIPVAMPGVAGTSCGDESAGAIVSTVPASASASAASFTTVSFSWRNTAAISATSAGCRYRSSAHKPAGASVRAVKNENA